MDNRRFICSSAGLDSLSFHHFYTFKGNGLMNSFSFSSLVFLQSHSVIILLEIHLVYRKNGSWVAHKLAWIIRVSLGFYLFNNSFHWHLCIFIIHSDVVWDPFLGREVPIKEAFHYSLGLHFIFISICFCIPKRIILLSPFPSWRSCKPTAELDVLKVTVWSCRNIAQPLIILFLAVDTTFRLLARG